MNTTEKEQKKVSRTPAVQLINGIKIFNESGTNRKVSALRGCDLTILPGQMVSIIGPSGAGKTTLLRIIAGLEELSSGEIYISGTSLHEMTPTLRQEFRRKYIGTFTQFGRANFDPKMRVHQAITWETLQAGWQPNAARKRTIELLDTLNLGYLRDSFCGQLSAGEAMRISFLKAVAKKPLLVLADEPTGQLDSTSMYQLYEVMRQILNEETAIMVATHDIRFQAVSDTSLLILDGKLASEEEGAELLSKRSVYFEKIMKEQAEVSSALFMDSTNSIRIPDSVIRRLKLGRQLRIKHMKDQPHAIIEPIESDLIDPGREEVISDFKRTSCTDEVMIESQNLAKSYGEVQVLNNVDFKVRGGEIVVLLGPSGSGKTTLLNMIAGLEQTSSGTLSVRGVNLDQSFGERRRIRTEEISYLTQNYIAHPDLTVLENSRLPLLLKNSPDESVASFEKNYSELIERLELINFENRLPRELSGGQQQRTSFLASVLKQTPILLADEPTANLDTALAVRVMNILIELAEKGLTVVLATHDFMLVQPNFRVMRIEDDGIIENVLADEEYCLNLQKLYLAT